MDSTKGEAATVQLKVMNIRLPPGSFYALLIVVLSVWVLHSFLQALLAACVTAIASWPLYARFMAALPRRIAPRSGASDLHA